ncbi:hypothetical protein ACFYW8_37480 [Streptomyces sp. NPDC002742]|uniref:hypothetical protein n=1 Tax=Streptomyces sp. NPDC002742 TaxID=3364663 RepID=UPI003679595D
MLADAMARSEVLSPATDDPRMHNAVGALDRLTALVFDDQVSVPAVEDAERAYLHVALCTEIEPDNLDHVPPAKPIRFRETHRAELAAFHDHGAGMGTELRAIAKVESL